MTEKTIRAWFISGRVTVECWPIFLLPSPLFSTFGVTLSRLTISDQSPTVDEPDTQGDADAFLFSKKIAFLNFTIIISDFFFLILHKLVIHFFEQITTFRACSHFGFVLCFTYYFVPTSCISYSVTSESLSYAKTATYSMPGMCVCATCIIGRVILKLYLYTCTYAKQGVSYVFVLLLFGTIDTKKINFWGQLKKLLPR